MSAHQLTKLTVNLIPSATQAIYALSETTGLSKTDVVNRALQLYRQLDDLQRDGQILYLKQGETEFAELHFDVGP